MTSAARRRTIQRNETRAALVASDHQLRFRAASTAPVTAAGEPFESGTTFGSALEDGGGAGAGFR
jgi:hypothetical protein